MENYTVNFQSFLKFSVILELFAHTRKSGIIGNFLHKLQVKCNRNKKKHSLTIIQSIRTHPSHHYSAEKLKKIANM